MTGSEFSKSLGIKVVQRLPRPAITKGKPPPSSAMSLLVSRMDGSSRIWKASVPSAREVRRTRANHSFVRQDEGARLILHHLQNVKFAKGRVGCRESRCATVS